MKKLIASAMLALSLGAAAPAAAFEPESTDTIKLMVADWSSMLIDTEILNIILSTYGYSVETVVADDSARYPGFENGDLIIALETWQTTQDKPFTASLATGKVLDMGVLGPHAKEEWWYPAYMAEKCPGLPDWKALKSCAEAFSSPETTPKGRYLGAPVSWGGFDEERVKALDLPFEVVHAGTEAAMFAELQSAYERKAPIIPGSTSRTGFLRSSRAPSSSSPPMRTPATPTRPGAKTRRQPMTAASRKAGSKKWPGLTAKRNGPAHTTSCASSPWTARNSAISFTRST